ncbi:MAG: tRNA pseudouridine(38-40) synthase TruA, partial [Syntrophales bacterium]|nr:tRNA pseudouridine(38-40) synthase TruA [Syntrophales bacterium]
DEGVVTRNLKMIVEYNGGGYHGWQRQNDTMTVQQVLEETIGIITREEIKVIGAGRTDAGVHAINQVANFKTGSKIEETKLLQGINSLLPKDVVVKHLVEVEETFHARHDARSKVYLYQIYNRPVRSVVYRDYAWFIRESLAIDRMRAALLLLKGTHDFSSFSAADKEIKNHVRTVMDVDVKVARCGMVKIYIEANGFLRYMVRNIVGTLVDVGKGRWLPTEFMCLIEAKDRRRAGVTAPPQGLFLMEVKY